MANRRPDDRAGLASQVSGLQAQLRMAERRLERPVCDCHTWPTVRELHDYTVAVERQRDKLREVAVDARETLEKVKAKVAEMSRLLRKHGYVFDNVFPVDSKGEHRWELLAFTFYTEIAEMSFIAEATHTALDEALGCVCNGPPMQPCGPRCDYPYADEALKEG